MQQFFMKVEQRIHGLPGKEKDDKEQLQKCKLKQNIFTLFNLKR